MDQSPFGVETPRDPRNIVLDGVSIPRGEGREFDVAIDRLLFSVSFTVCLQCFDAVGLAAGRASGL